MGTLVVRGREWRKPLQCGVAAHCQRGRASTPGQAGHAAHVGVKGGGFNFDF